MSTSSIFVGGAGGIGSWLTLFLARTGALVHVVDMDIVEEHNIAGQVYGKEFVGTPKVNAIEFLCKQLCGEDVVNGINEEVTEDRTSFWFDVLVNSSVVCVGFDNLKARRLVYEAWKECGLKDSMFIDGRLSAESGQIFVVTKQSSEEELKAYEATYFDESERVELPCTMKATSHCGALIASLMTAQITNWFNNTLKEGMPRQISNIEFHLPVMLIDQPVLVKSVKVQEDAEIVHS